MIDIFSTIKDGEIDGTWYADRDVVGIERRAAASSEEADIIVNARDIPNGPIAGQAIYMGSIIPGKN